MFVPVGYTVHLGVECNTTFLHSYTAHDDKTSRSWVGEFAVFESLVEATAHWNVVVGLCALQEILELHSTWSTCKTEGRIRNRAYSFKKYNYSQSPSGRMCQKRHVLEMFEITYFHPFRGLDIVLGRRDYHHSFRHEILPWNSGLTFILAQF